MGGSEHLTVGEFERGINRIEARFDRLETKIDGHTERIVALESTAKAKTRKAATWSAAAAGLAMAVIEGFRAYLR